MNEIIIRVEDGVIQAVYSNDPDVKVVVYDFDWQENGIDEMRNALDEACENMHMISEEFVRPFDFQNLDEE